MSDAITVTIEARDTFSSIWLKGIEAVDLETHCLSTFIGPRYRQVDRNKKLQTVTIEPGPREVALYLCGVTAPYRWADNAHLALRPSLGAQWHGEAAVPGLVVTLLGAEPLSGWGEWDVPMGHPQYGDRLYRTCRNLQFGWWAHRHLGAENRINPDRLPTQPARKPGGRPSGGKRFLFGR